MEVAQLHGLPLRVIVHLEKRSLQLMMVINYIVFHQAKVDVKQATTVLLTKTVAKKMMITQVHMVQENVGRQHVQTDVWVKKRSKPIQTANASTKCCVKPAVNANLVLDSIVVEMVCVPLLRVVKSCMGTQHQTNHLVFLVAMLS